MTNKQGMYAFEHKCASTMQFVLLKHFSTIEIGIHSRTNINTEKSPNKFVLKVGIK